MYEVRFRSTINNEWWYVQDRWPLTRMRIRTRGPAMQSWTRADKDSDVLVYKIDQRPSFSVDVSAERERERKRERETWERVWDLIKSVCMSVSVCLSVCVLSQCACMCVCLSHGVCVSICVYDIVCVGIRERGDRGRGRDNSSCTHSLMLWITHVFLLWLPCLARFNRSGMKIMP